MSRTLRVIVLSALTLPMLAAGILTGATGQAQAQNGIPAATPAHRAAVMQACRPDYFRLCNGVPQADGRLAACFRANAWNLSSPCRNALVAALFSGAPR
jgi:hypothetical protein